MYFRRINCIWTVGYCFGKLSFGRLFERTKITYVSIFLASMKWSRNSLFSSFPAVQPEILTNTFSFHYCGSHLHSDSMETGMETRTRNNSYTTLCISASRNNAASLLSVLFLWMPPPSPTAGRFACCSSQSWAIRKGKVLLRLEVLWCNMFLFGCQSWVWLNIKAI